MYVKYKILKMEIAFKFHCETNNIFKPNKNTKKRARSHIELVCKKSDSEVN